MGFTRPNNFKENRSGCFQYKVNFNELSDAESHVVLLSELQQLRTRNSTVISRKRDD